MSKRVLCDLAGVLAAMFLPFCALAQPAIYYEEAIITNLDKPIHMAHAGDGSDRIFVAERPGVVKVFSKTYSYLGVYLDISSRISTDQEGALFSIAFHPNFETNGCFFVHFSDKNGNIVVSRYDSSTPSANTMDDLTPVDVITIPHPNKNHYGGEMHFLPDGNLFISTGDGGGTVESDPDNNSQSETSLLGKILRITPATSGATTYTIPSDNPFPTDAGLARNEVFAMGLRNPFRWSFDRSTGDVWIGDVGEHDREEIDFVAAANFKGTNFGWRCYEGTIRNPAYASGTYDTECDAYANFPPRYEYARVSGPVSVVGGVIYRGTKYPDMAGYYVGSDIFTHLVHVLAPDATTLSPMAGLVTTFDFLDFGESEDGDIFAVSMGQNKIYHFADPNALPVTLSDFQGRASEEGIKLTWKSVAETNFRHFEVEHSTDAKRFTGIGVVESRNLTGGSNYQYVHSGASQGNNYYRLKMVDTDETFAYSRIVSVQTQEGSKGFVFPSVITGGTMSVNLDRSSGTLEIINTAGQVLLTSDVNGKTGKVDVQVGHLAAGLYIARLRSEGVASVQQKVMIVP